MLSKINTAALQGIEAIPIVVETDVTKGMPHFTIVGLADAGVKESKERIRAAIRSSGLEYPLGRLTVNMSPADFRKRGTILDLPMAMGILAASGQLVPEELAEYAFVGELSLDGGIRRVNGVLPALMAMRECGIRRVVVPEENRREASLLKDLQIYAARDLLSVVRHCGTGPRLPKVDPIEVREQNGEKHLLAYSLGNFVSNQSRPNTDGGTMVRMTLTKRDGHTTLTDCGYNLYWVSRPVTSGRRQYRVLPAGFPSDSLNATERAKRDTYLKNTRALFAKHNKGIEEYIVNVNN